MVALVYLTGTFTMDGYIKDLETLRYHLRDSHESLNIIQILGLKRIASQINTQGW